MNNTVNLNNAFPFERGLNVFVPAVITYLAYKICCKVTEVATRQFKKLEGYNKPIALFAAATLRTLFAARLFPILFLNNPILMGVAMVVDYIAVMAIGITMAAQAFQSQEIAMHSALIEMTAEKMKDKYTRLSGREGAIQEIERALNRPAGSQSILLIGDPSSEPGLIPEECARRIVQDDLPEQSLLRNKKIYSINASLLANVGTLTDLQKNLSALSQKGDVILVIDQIELLKGVIWTSSILGSYIKSGRIMVIGITSPSRDSEVRKLPFVSSLKSIQVAPIQAEDCFLAMQAKNEKGQFTLNNLRVNDTGLALATLLSYDHVVKGFVIKDAAVLLRDVLFEIGVRGLAELDSKLFLDHWKKVYLSGPTKISLASLSDQSKEFFRKKELNVDELVSVVTTLNTKKKDAQVSIATHFALVEMTAEKMKDKYTRLSGREGAIQEIESALNRLAGSQSILLIGDPSSEPGLIPEECARRIVQDDLPEQSLLRNKKIYSINASLLANVGTSTDLQKNLSALSQKRDVILVIDQIELLKDVRWVSHMLETYIKNGEIIVIGITSPSQHSNVRGLPFVSSLKPIRVAPIQAEDCFLAMQAKNEKGQFILNNLPVNEMFLALATLLSYHHVVKRFVVKDAAVLLRDVLFEIEVNRLAGLDSKPFLDHWEKVYLRGPTKISLASLSDQSKEFFRKKELNVDDLVSVVTKLNTKKKDAQFSQEDIPNFLSDMNEAAREGKYPPCNERESDIQTLISVVKQPLKKSLVLLGPPGIGKTAIFEEIARRIVTQDSSIEAINDKTLYWVDVGALVASGGGMVGGIEKSVTSMIDFSQRMEGKAILVIDELHLLRGAGVYKGSNTDILEWIKTSLSRDDIIVWGTANDFKWDPIVIADPAIGRRFTPIHIEPPPCDVCIRMLKDSNFSGFYTANYQPAYVAVTSRAIETAVNLTEKLIKDTYLPDKATSLISQAVSFYQQEEERARARGLDKERPIRRISSQDIAIRLFHSIKHRKEFSTTSMDMFLGVVMGSMPADDEKESN